MLDKVIRFSLSNRFLILLVGAALIVAGARCATRLPIDVLPDLNRPRVTVMTECPGLAPEEAESLVTIPLETALVGATGVETIRSSSVIGLSTIVVEFSWDADLYRSRQIVFERMQRAIDELPEGVSPQITPISSVMGQILALAVYSESGQTSAMDLRSVADWDIRRKLLAQKGVSEVFSMGGERRQYQVLLRPDDLLRYDLTVDEVEEALRKSNRNATGGFLTEQGPKQFLVRALGRVKRIDDLKSLVVKDSTEPPVLLEQVADVVEGASVAVGDGSVAIKREDGTIFESPAVVLTVEKQPEQDVRSLTDDILKETERLEASLRERYPDLKIVPLYQQRSFVELAVDNVLSALRDGAILVALVVFLFLTSVRTTFVTLVTIPSTLACACLVFAGFGLSVNAMTLGGLAVSIGELVDDAIVDVENIHRRLQENLRLGSPLSTLDVVFGASSEIRRSVVNGTAITVLVFFPIFFLQGIEGKLFAPLGIAYVASLLSSLLISLTLTPVLSHAVLKGRFGAKARERFAASARKDVARAGIALRFAQWVATGAMRFSLRFPNLVLIGAVLLGVLGTAIFFNLERDFMPPFNEGAIQVNLDLAPGASLKTSAELGERLASELIRVDGIEAVARKTGRSEMDEHAVPVNVSEFICSIDQTSDRKFSEIVDDVCAVIAEENVPGALTSFDQPLQHLVNHLRSGSSAKLAVKISGDDLARLRENSEKIKEALADVEDVGSLRVEPNQADLPQVQIRLKRDELARRGLTPEDVERTISVALNGSVATVALEGERPVETLTRLGTRYRENLELLRRLPLHLPEKVADAGAPSEPLEKRSALDDELGGDPSSDRGVVPLDSVAEIDARALGPAQIDRENGRRQVSIQLNPRHRGGGEVKDDVEARLAPLRDELTVGGTDVRIAGLFESEASATRTLLALSCLSGLAIFALLFKMFRSANLALQVMAIVPLALVGGIAALYLTGQSRTIPALIGLISLCGVASRNGVLLLERYLRLVEYEGEGLTRSMIIRAGRERVAPVLMTALTSAIGLAPLASAPNLPGREALYPIATVMIGGLLTSTLLEFFVRPALFWSFGLNAAKRCVEYERAARDKDGSFDERLSEQPPKFETKGVANDDVKQALASLED